jgi:hypothetical protein
MSKLKKVRAGKIKRHKLRQELGVKQGFGKPWSAPSLIFRVEFNWQNQDGSEENEQTHWIECRNFKGEERKSLTTYYRQNNTPWGENETVESKFVCAYVARFLIENRDKLSVNQAFIFPSTKKNNETIRQPIYILRWTKDLAETEWDNEDVAIVFKNSIYHHPNT